MDTFGIGRSMEPAHSLPQQAWRIDNTTELRPDELLIDVKIVSINLVSFNEIWDETGDNDTLLCQRVMEIIQERGKLHNPVTNTGGMLYGKVAQMGSEYPNLYGLAPGDEIISLASLSITPLKLDRILCVDYACAQLTVEGQAILYASSPVVKRPPDIPLQVVISAMDEAGVSACTHRIVEPGQSVLVLGAGGRSGLLCGYAARDKMKSSGRLVGIVRNENHRQLLERYGVYDEVLALDATDIEGFCSGRESAVAQQFDVVINCINSVNTEIAALVAVKPRGILYFATLGCDYKFTGLTAEGIGKQVHIIPYAGFMEGHAEYTLGLLRRFPQMQKAIQQQFGEARRHHVLVEHEEHSETRDDTHVANANGYIFRSSQSKATLRQALKVSRYTSNVMIYGESGVGKEIIARIIHQNSERKTFPMIKINCAAIPENLLESELFGYEKGSFTGANAKGKIGLWEAAQSGTLFLDEVGELPLSFQAKLLRVLETGEVMRVGGTRIVKTDVRLIAATNRDLRRMAAEGRFREDLYYRLNVMPLFLPPLRERREDILPLAELFLAKNNRKYGLSRALTQEMRRGLLAYGWPGNIRELRNVIERYAISGRMDIQSPAAAAPAVPAGAGREPEMAEETPLHEACARFEQAYIQKALDACGGSVSKAARRLGIHRSLLYKKLKKSEPVVQ